jgi:putative ABC transport system permease protein
MMSYRLWQEQFNGDRKILGATLTLNGELRTLIGIMPPGFQFFGTRIWLPLSLSASATGSPEHSDQPIGLYAYGRRKSGVSLRAAAADLNVVAQQHSRIDPNHYPKKFTVATDTLTDATFGHYKAMLYTMFAAVTLLLLIACSNVANLLLVRARVRERELAIRSAIGASRGRLVRQLLVETFVLAATGAFVGCLLSYLGLKGAVALLPPDAIPNEGAVALNPPVLLFALAVTMFTTLVCGLVPALRAVRGELPLRLKEGSQGVSGGWLHGKVRSGLVIVQVALSILLLVGAGLMMRAFLALEHVNLRFNPRDVLDAWLALPEGHYETANQKRILFQQIFDRVRELPEVVAVAEATAMPLFGGPVSDVVVPGESNSDSLRATLQLCSPGYFKTLGLDLTRGRLLSEADIDSARKVAVINQTLARDSFGKQDPLGRRIKFKLLDALPDSPHDTYFEVIGIVADDKNQDLRKPPAAEVFLPYTLTGLGVRALLVRTKTGAPPILERVRKEVWAVDPDIAFHGVETIEIALKERAYAQPEVGAITLGTFAAMGLVLVAIGVFSVMAYSVSLRTHEIGIHMALGAQRGNVLRMVLVKGLILIAAGIAVGEVASVVLARLMANQIWGVSATDPLTFGAVIAVTLIVGFLACWLPARRATQVDPLIALRYE